MGTFFKTLGYGVLYTVLSPVFLLILLVYAVYCLILFIIQSIINIIVFFSGGTIGGDLKEDVEAKKILLERQNQTSGENSTQPSTQNVFIFQGQQGQVPTEFIQNNPQQMSLNNQGVTMKKPIEIEMNDATKPIEVDLVEENKEGNNL